MRVVVVGGTGQLGRELARVLPGADTVVLSRAELDLTDTAAVAPRLAAERLRVVPDQVTAPTWARDVAAALARLLPRLVRGDAPGGIYHLTNAGACSWYEFARAALALAGVDAEVEPITSAELAAPAPRPPYSVLANTRLAAIGEPPLRHWRDALAAYLAD